MEWAIHRFDNEWFWLLYAEALKIRGVTPNRVWPALYENYPKTIQTDPDVIKLIQLVLLRDSSISLCFSQHLIFANRILPGSSRWQVPSFGFTLGPVSTCRSFDNLGLPGVLSPELPSCVEGTKDAEEFPTPDNFKSGHVNKSILQYSSINIHPIFIHYYPLVN